MMALGYLPTDPVLVTLTGLPWPVKMSTWINFAFHYAVLELALGLLAASHRMAYCASPPSMTRA